VIGGGIWDGLTRAWRSPYLLQICLYMLLFTTLQTFVYFQQATLVDQSYTSGPARTQFFARLDLGVNVLTLVVQLFLTSRIIQGVGVAYALAVLPAITIVGFVVLGAMPTVAVIVAFQIIRRATEFALARPTRELLYSVVEREDKYKAKSFIDTFVYRTGDQVGAWTYTLMVALGLGVVGVAWIAIPLGVAWLLNGLWLGRRQERMVKDDPGAGSA
jgi:AAA family ATP:ADP antiporter